MNDAEKTKEAISQIQNIGYWLNITIQSPPKSNLNANTKRFRNPSLS